jgi:hypothetical protein
VFHPRDEPEQLPRTNAVGVQYPSYLWWAAQGEGARLVEHRHPDSTQSLQGGAVAEDDPVAGRSVEPADDGDGRDEDQRAESGHDEHGEHPDRILGEQPGRPADEQRQWGEPRGVTVREPPAERHAGRAGDRQRLRL